MVGCWHAHALIHASGPLIMGISTSIGEGTYPQSQKVAFVIYSWHDHALIHALVSEGVAPHYGAV